MEYSLKKWDEINNFEEPSYFLVAKAMVQQI